MFSIGLIVFREIFEIALIVSVVIVATRGLAGRGLWIGIGLGGGILGAILVAVFAQAISNFAEGMGQEIFNAGVLFTAAVLIGGTAVWMRSHARDLAVNLKRISESVQTGDLPLYTLGGVIALAVWREGSEIALFLYGMTITGTSIGNLVLGSIGGMVCGVALGAALYFGLLKISTRYLFQVTGWLLILLAAGMAAQGAKLLADAGIFERGITPLWDTGHLLSEKSLLGQSLHALLGYSSQPIGIQLIFYVGTLAFLISIMQLIAMERRMHLRKTAHFALAGIFLVFTSPGAFAVTGKISSPIVDEHEVEIEFDGVHTFDSEKEKDHIQETEISIGYGFTDFWKVELAGIVEREPGDSTHYAGTEIENTFQFWDTGKYFVDAGVKVTYGFAADRDEADELEVKLLLQNNYDQWITLVNFGVEREVGAHSSAGNEFSLAANTRYRVSRYFEPGIEFQTDLGTWSERNSFDDNAAYVGPIAYGKFLTHFEYEAGYLVGVTDKASDGAFRFKLAYEFPF